MKQSLKLMIDSSLLVESLKGKEEAREMLKLLINNKDKIVLFINPFVKNEVIFVLLVYLSKLSPRTLKKKKEKVKEIMEELKKKVIKFLDTYFTELSFNSEQSNLAYNLCEKYGLLPTDASILATCGYYNIPYIISLDEDFRESCENEGVTLINSIEKLKELLKID